MKNVVAFSLAAIAGSALAAPAAHRGNPHIVYKTEVYTVIVTPGASQPTPAPEAPKETAVYSQWTPSPAPAKPTTTVVVVEKHSSAAYQPPASSAPAASSAAPAASSAPSTGGSYTYMNVVKEWRSKMGLAELTQDSTLEANAKKTCVDGNGEMKHELNPGSFAQVLAPGSMDDETSFTKVFVGGWLCEKPNMAGLDGICSSLSSGWAYDGQTGHADILSSTSYTKIGCAESNGIVGCDLA